MVAAFLTLAPRMAMLFSSAVAVLLFFAATSVLYRSNHRWYGGQNRRAAARRHGNPVTVAIATDENPPRPLGQGLVLDRSAGGVGLFSPYRADEGTILKVRPGRTSGWARVEVRRCEKQDDCWRLSCRFVEVPPWRVLSGFG